MSDLEEVNFWTKDNLNKITAVFFEKGEQNWCRMCSEFGIIPGFPDFYIKNAYYDKKAVAEYYDFEETPRYDKLKNTVVFENPFIAPVSYVFSETCEYPPPLTKFVEIDAETAKKILVLGLP